MKENIGVFVVLMIIAMGVAVGANKPETSLKYWDCVHGEDDFYGEYYGNVIAKDKEGNYTVYIGVFAPQITAKAKDLKKVDTKFCEQKNGE